jgi:hypothetical protein
MDTGTVIVALIVVLIVLGFIRAALRLLTWVIVIIIIVLALSMNAKGQVLNSLEGGDYIEVYSQA